jgi:hypothetical protein
MVNRLLTGRWTNIIPGWLNMLTARPLHSRMAGLVSVNALTSYPQP